MFWSDSCRFSVGRKDSERGKTLHAWDPSLDPRMLLEVQRAKWVRSQCDAQQLLPWGFPWAHPARQQWEGGGAQGGPYPQIRYQTAQAQSHPASLPFHVCPMLWWHPLTAVGIKITLWGKVQRSWARAALWRILTVVILVGAKQESYFRGPAWWIEATSINYLITDSSSDPLSPLVY